MSPLVLALSFVAFGCSSYHYVKQDDTGGTVALDGDRDSAMEKAEAAMGEHCNGPYQITNQGEELVSKNPNEFDMSQSAGGREDMVNQYEHEYRVSYICQAR